MWNRFRCRDWDESNIIDHKNIFWIFVSLKATKPEPVTVTFTARGGACEEVM